MNADHITRLAKPPAAWAWSLTILSCALVIAATLTGHRVLLALLAVVVPLALVAAVQVTSVAPLAAEVLRMREELARTRR